MKPTLLAAIAALTLATPALANSHPHTKSNFENTYTKIVNDAAQQGIHMQTACWKGYCSTSLLINYSDGFAIASRNVYDNGIETREFCGGPNVNSLDRRCWVSTGEVVDEHWDGHIWQTTQTLAKAFDDEEAGAAL